MGLIDGIYAIAMTLIAFELQVLALQLIEATTKQTELTIISGLLMYELISYAVTFLILCECGHSKNPSSSSLESGTPART